MNSSSSSAKHRWSAVLAEGGAPLRRRAIPAPASNTMATPSKISSQPNRRVADVVGSATAGVRGNCGATATGASRVRMGGGNGVGARQYAASSDTE